MSGSSLRHGNEASENVVSDAIGYFTVYKSSKDYPEKLRKGICIDPEDGTRYIFLTNNLTASAETITELYRNRWSVELFFKWIKQHLRIVLGGHQRMQYASKSIVL